jgi:type 1 fimbriae regulatory protein FimB/type 1 fimbriae regulatory protein FimE
LRVVSPRTLIRTVSLPRRKPNAELRTREFLTEPEIERLMKAAKSNRYGQRDAAMILIAYRHGLRAAELVDLRWDQVELGRNGVLHVRRVKNGVASTHPLQGDEMRALRQFALRVRERARRPVHHGRLRQDSRPRWRRG